MSIPARITLLFAAWAVTLVTLLAGAPQAQADTLVSNLGQTLVDHTGLNHSDVAQGFTTGANVGGYILTSVDLDLHKTGSPTMKLMTGLSSTAAGTEVATLNPPDSIAVGTNTFTAPANTTLSASTTYFLVFEGSGNVRKTSATGEDSDKAAGWSLADVGLTRSASSTGGWTPEIRANKIRINGTIVTLPTITISGGDAVTEGTDAEFTVTADSAPPADLTVNLTVSESSNGDYVTSGNEGSKTVTISATTTSATYNVPTQADTTGEPNGSVMVTVAAGTGYTVGMTSSASVTVNDDDTAPCTNRTDGFWSGIAINTSSTSSSVTITVPSSTSVQHRFDLCKTGSSSIHQNSGNIGPKTYTFTGLDKETQYWARVHTAGKLTSEWIAIKTKAASAPSFDDGAAKTLSIAENNADAAAVGTVAATDADGDTLTYSLLSAGSDHNSFTIDASGNIKVATGVTLDHEAKSSYSMFAEVTDGEDSNGDTEQTATIDDSIIVTISVTDANEPPAAPTAPTVAATSGSSTSLDVSWIAPDTAGKPAITDYDVQYQASGETTWISHRFTGTGTSTTISSLTANTTYNVQVKATNAEGSGGWSPSGSGKTAADTTSPTVSGATVKDTSLVITFSETLGAAANLANSAFTVKKTPQGGTESTVSLSGTPSISSDTVTLTLAAAVVATDTGVKVTYTKPASGTNNKLIDAVGNEADGFSNQAVTIDTAPTVSGAPSVTSDPGSDSTYAIGDAISVKVTFDENVTVTGTPQLEIAVGANNRQANYASGSGSTELTFSYTVVAGDADSDGVSVAANKLTLNSGTIKDATGNNATLTHVALAAQSGHKVDGVAPTVSGATATDTSLVITFSETLGAAANLANSAFTVKKTPQGGTESTVSLSGTPSISGDTVTLTLAAAVVATDTGVKVTYTKPASGTNNKLIDAVGNEAAGFSNQAVTIHTAPGRPGPPAVSVAGSTSLNVSWSAPSSLGTATSIADYDLRYHVGAADPDNEADWIEEGETGGPPDPGTATMATITGLMPYDAYRVQVRAEGDGESPWSTSGTATTSKAPETGPARPPGCTDPLPNIPDYTWFSSVTSTDSSITVTFVDPIPVSGTIYLQLCSPTGASRYGLAWMFHLAPTAGESRTIDKAGVGHTGAALTANTDYWVKIAYDLSGARAESAYRHVRTKNSGTSNTTPFFPATAPETLEVAENSAGGTEVGAVAATDPDGDTLSYSLDTTSDAVFDIDDSGVITVQSGATLDFESGTTSYPATVTASDGSASAAHTVTIDVTNVPEPPDAPAAPSVTAASSASLSVSWTAPDVTGKPAITDYDLRYWEGSADPEGRGGLDRGG